LKVLIEQMREQIQNIE
ncbi:DUF1732 domain-containing protein, partial [Salmonella enterica]|nr:DUF1732 domain-containing protein [Salmonella enterica subsp. enterica serovar 4,[5],12:i:-]EEI0623978.1 DUF1732 domain-containing protein [Salmonella enterica]EHB3024572.1 DUF1732 domain-containing protein [Salmonella enterica subsp. enterica serovar Typhi]EJN6572454.1 DUF1732 domain-containing protein [Salmonella enterica subsp. enterica serovar Agona]MBE8421142.1 DUF1732 domain-containing protein [Leptospira interrogans serovar Pomona]NEN74084.1 DUF1732 domain-containing protein [Escheri